MLKDLFLTPGRMLIKFLPQAKKRVYRSPRSRGGSSLGMVALSLVCWLILAGFGLYTIDKAGLLTSALDVGVEAVQKNAAPQGELAPPTEPVAPPEPVGNASGIINPNSQPGTSPPASIPASPTTTTQTAQAAPQVETEMWLVILHTIPKNARNEAERRKTQYKSKGLEVEIMDTDAFPRLKAGNWVIAQGPFDDRASAVAAANKAKAFNQGLIILRGL